MAVDVLTTVPADPDTDAALCLATAVHTRLVALAPWLGFKASNIEDHPIDPFEDKRDLPGIAVFLGDISEPFNPHMPPAADAAQADVLIEVFVSPGTKWAATLRPLMARIRQGILRDQNLLASGLFPDRLTERHDIATKGTERAVRGLITLTLKYRAYYPPVLPDTLDRIDVDLGQPTETPGVIAQLTPADC